MGRNLKAFRYVWARPGGVMHRLPTWFPNVPLYLHPPALTEEKEADIRAGKFVRDVVFRTVPKANKFEIRQILERMYNLEVERIATLNYEGKKKPVFSRGARAKILHANARGTPLDQLKLPRPQIQQRPDWKKVFVTFKPPPAEAQAPNQP